MEDKEKGVRLEEPMAMVVQMHQVAVAVLEEQVDSSLTVLRAAHGEISEDMDLFLMLPLVELQVMVREKVALVGAVVRMQATPVEVPVEVTPEDQHLCMVETTKVVEEDPSTTALAPSIRKGCRQVTEV